MSKTFRYNPDSHQKDVIERRHVHRKWKSKEEKENFYRDAYSAKPEFGASYRTLREELQPLGEEDDTESGN